MLFLLFLLCRFPLCRDVPSGISCAADGLFILLILTPLWRRQMIGGGDVKILQYFSEYIRIGGLRRGHPYEGPERERAELPFLPFLFLGALLGCWWGGVL